MKRLLDILTSSIALFLLFPLLAVIAIAIKIDSDGPVLFIQRRVGRDGRFFSILKFRTMVSREADKIDQRNEKVVSEGNDSRITRVGRLLRSTSLDELPQLWNILRGDMSLVGPRPIIPEQKEFIPPSYLKRLSVAPGLTGLAQVKGRRSLGWLEQLALDLEYVEKRSFLFDLKLLIATAWVVIARKGVYGAPGMNWRTYAKSLNGKAPRDQDVTDAVSRGRGRS